MPSYLRQQKFPFGSLRTDPHWSTEGLIYFSQFKPAGILIDETTNKNNGTLTGSPTWVTDALLFNGGTSDLVTILHSNILNISSPATIILWIKFTSADNTVILDKNGNAGFSVIPFSGGNILCHYGGTSDSDRLRTVNEFDDGQWHQVAFVFRGTTVNGSVFVDAMDDTDGAATGNGTPAYGVDTSMSIGSRGGASGFNGSVKSILIYNRELLQRELLSLYINPDLLFQQYPAWLAKAAVAAGVTIPVMIHHYKQAGGL